MTFRKRISVLEQRRQSAPGIASTDENFEGGPAVVAVVIHTEADRLPAPQRQLHGIIATSRMPMKVPR